MIYYGRDGQPISQEEAMRLFRDQNARRVALDQLVQEGGALTSVSTVHLVIDTASPGGIPQRGAPVIFETMVFGLPEENEYQWRYSTEEQALAGHQRVVEALKAGAPLDEV